MIDEQRLSDLPSFSRMAWSSRPVWDRRAAVGKRHHRGANLEMARRHRRDGGARPRFRGRTTSLNRTQSVVARQLEVAEKKK